eukprot:3072418-Pyramimonas_sp.AAC.1
MELNELELAMSQNDAIMEPTILDTLRRYVAAGARSLRSPYSSGKPQSAVELISENYRGYAQMASLVCSWLKLVNEPSPVGDSKDEAVVDEVHFLSELVKEKFEPRQADTVFNSGAAAPAWLERMLQLQPFAAFSFPLADLLCYINNAGPAWP